MNTCMYTFVEYHFFIAYHFFIEFIWNTCLKNNVCCRFHRLITQVKEYKISDFITFVQTRRGTSWYKQRGYDLPSLVQNKHSF